MDERVPESIYNFIDSTGHKTHYMYMRKAEREIVNLKKHIDAHTYIPKYTLQ